MTKQEFLKILEAELKRLPESDRADILRDQEEYIREAMSDGRSEAHVIDSLGDPAKLAKALVAEARIAETEQAVAPSGSASAPPRPAGLPTQMSATVRAVFAFAALAPFNLIFVLGPFCAICGILFAGWAVGGAIALVGGGVLFVWLTELLTLGGSFWATIASILLGTGILALGAGALGLLALFTAQFLQLTLKYLRWNIDLILNQKN